MRIVCAGGGNPEYIVACYKYRVPKLYSILYEKKLIATFPFHNHFLMVDSGAHSWNKFTMGHIGVKSQGNLPDPLAFMNAYKDYILQFNDKNYIFVEFDVYGTLDKKIIDNFYYEMIKKIGKQKLIRVYHPLIDNGTLEELDKWISEGHEYIGIGNDSTYLLDKIFKKTRDRIKIHGFAMTKFELLKKFPFYSCDSTKAIAVSSFGQYIDINMKSVSKSKLVKDKDPRMLLSKNNRFDTAIKNIREAEYFLTKLWEKRGIVWKDEYET